MPRTKNTDERNQTRPKSREGSRLGRPSVKLSFLPDFIYRSNAISVAIPIAFLKKKKNNTYTCCLKGGKAK